MTDEQDARVRTAYHEAAHAVISQLVGVRVELISMHRSEEYGAFVHHGGHSIPCSDPSVPLLLQPADVRRGVESWMTILLAGRVGEELPGPRSGFFYDTAPCEQAAEASAMTLAHLSPRHRELVTSHMGSSGPSDDDKVIWVAGDLAGAEAIHHFALMGAIARRLVYENAPPRRGLGRGAAHA
jgi:hypothetical protein